MVAVVAIDIGNDDNGNLVAALVVGATVRTETGAHKTAVDVDRNARSGLDVVLVVDGEDAIGGVAFEGAVELDDSDDDEDHDHRGEKKDMTERHLVCPSLSATFPHPAAAGALRRVFEECVKGT
jgi:hypothetical protein